MQTIGGGPDRYGQFGNTLRPLGLAGAAAPTPSPTGTNSVSDVAAQVSTDVATITSADAAASSPAPDRLESNAPRIPLSLADRVSLSREKKQMAQAYYEVGRDLAQRVTGDSESFNYKKTVGLTNLDDSASLFALQARYGDNGTTARSVPVTIAAMAMGALNNVPIEGATVKDGKLTEARATGHSLNPVLNLASAVVAGVALTLAPPLAAVALAGPLLTASPLVAQRFGDTNAPVHEMAHAMQFLLLGDLMNRGMIDPTDLVAIQNDTGKAGYLWGGETEKAAHAAETTGDIGPLFDVLESRVAERLEERHGLSSQPVTEAAQKLLADHRAWMTQELARRLPTPTPA